MSLDRSDISRYITSALAEHDGTLKTLAPIELWVDADRGKDSNDGSKKAPLASLVEAERRIPYIVDHPVMIWVAPHSDPSKGYEPPSFRERIIRAPIDVVGTEYKELYSGTLKTGSNHTKFIVDAGLGVNTYQGKIIEMTSGELKGFRRTISRNTDTELWPAACFPNHASVGTTKVGDTFRIIEPVVAIKFPRPQRGQYAWNVSEGDYTFMHGGPFDGVQRPLSGVISIAGFRFLGRKDEADAGGNPFGHVLAVLSARPLVLSGCEVENFSGFQFVAGTFKVGFEHVNHGDYTDTNNVWERVTVGARVGYTEQSWVGCGLYIKPGITTMQANQARTIYYGFVAPMLWAFGGFTNFRAGNIYTSGIIAASQPSDGTCTIQLDGKMYLPDLDLVINSNGVGVSVSGNTLLGVQDTTITSAGIGIQATSGALVQMGNGISINSGGAGIQLRFGARCQTSGTNPVITSSANHIEVGETPEVGTVAGNLGSVGAHITADDGTTIQRVV